MDLDGTADGSLSLVAVDSAVDHTPVYYGVVVWNVGCTTDNSDIAGRHFDDAIEITVAEMAFADEAIPVRLDKAVIVDVDEADSCFPSSFKRERRPADVTRTAPPCDPSRAPDSSGNPDPTEARIEFPAAIVVRSPTPRIVRDPDPTVIGIGSRL